MFVLEAFLKEGYQDCNHVLIKGYQSCKLGPMPYSILETVMGVLLEVKLEDSSIFLTCEEGDTVWEGDSYSDKTQFQIKGGRLVRRRGIFYVSGKRYK